MKKSLSLLWVLCLVTGFPFAGSAMDKDPDNFSDCRAGDVHAEKSSEEGWFDSLDWDYIKGRPARDALVFGMWSLHLDGSGEFFGTGSNNDHNHLLGFQYRGLNAGTFINSHWDRTYSAGLSREVYSRQFSPDLRFDAGYRAGFLYGYEDNLPNILGVSAYAMPVVGFSWKRAGLDIGLTPVGVLTLNFRLDIDTR
jgi:hypothetical protein